MPATFSPLRGALAVTIIYLGAGALWIALSDRVLLSLVEDPQQLTHLQTLKGWAYVLLSGILVLGLSYAVLRAQARGSAVGRRLQTVLDTIPSRVAWKDGSGRYLGCNAAFARDAGIETPEAIRGLTDRALAWAGEAGEMEEADRSVLASGRRQRKERIPVQLASDELRWVDVSRVPLQGTAPGEATGILFCYDDVTEQVDADIRLRRSQRIQEVGQLTSGLAHDFKNVLSVIGANTDLVEERRLSEPEIREAFQDIRQATTSAQELVRKLLGSSRKADLSLEDVDLTSVVEGLAPMLSRLLRHTHRFRVEVAPDLPLVRCDPGAVEQMIMNLVTNARDATADHTGEILLRLDTDWASPDAIDEKVRISVADQGTGIPTDVLARIFEPFFTTKTNLGGTGLGLPMVQGLMEQHGGSVAVESEEGRGTTVHLLFPALERVAPGEGVPSEVRGDSEASPRAVAMDDSPSRGETILVVEDQPDLRRTIRRVLRHSGYQVLEAPDGPAGLELARAHRDTLSLILSDLSLPGFGGMDLYRRLQAEEVFVPFAITTGQADLNGAATNEEEASLPFIPKPWTVAELAGGVRRILDEGVRAPRGAALPATPRGVDV
jgi:signal transduction histidine kinase/ActR/RegA family two-component response regulator